MILVARQMDHKAPCLQYYRASSLLHSDFLLIVFILHSPRQTSIQTLQSQRFNQSISNGFLLVLIKKNDVTFVAAVRRATKNPVLHHFITRNNRCMHRKGRTICPFLTPIQSVKVRWVSWQSYSTNHRKKGAISFQPQLELETFLTNQVAKICQAVSTKMHFQPQLRHG